ncbi:MAG: flagellar hook-basal body complex protein FliE [Desulfarculaceae bacterium]|jgi:flagellar hook-basal body complex protein FliE
MADMRVFGYDPTKLHSLDPKREPEAEKKGFVETMKNAIAKVDELQKTADLGVEDLASGRRRTLHETMIQVEQADIAFRLLMAVRGKVVSAYQEIMRMHF